MVPREEGGQRYISSHPHQHQGGEEGCSPEKQAWKVQHSRCGWRLPSAGASAQTLQCKASLEGPQVVLEDQSTSGWKFSLSGMVSGLQASVLDSKAINGQATRSPALGHAEKMKNMGQAVCHPSLYALKRGLMLTRVIPPRRPWLLVCVRSPVTLGFANDDFPLLNQSFLEGSPAQPEGTGQALVPAFQAWSTQSATGSPRKGLSLQFTAWAIAGGRGGRCSLSSRCLRAPQTTWHTWSQCIWPSLEGQPDRPLCTVIPGQIHRLGFLWTLPPKCLSPKARRSLNKRGTCQPGRRGPGLLLVLESLRCPRPCPGQGTVPYQQWHQHL